MRITDAEKILSQWVKVAKCNFKSKAQLHEHFQICNEMKCFLQMQKTDIHVFELFLQNKSF